MALGGYEFQFHVKLKQALQEEIAEAEANLWQSPQEDYATYRAEAARIEAKHKVLELCDQIHKELMGEDKKR